MCAFGCCRISLLSWRLEHSCVQNRSTEQPRNKNWMHSFTYFTSYTGNVLSNHLTQDCWPHFVRWEVCVHTVKKTDCLYNLASEHILEIRFQAVFFSNSFFLHVYFNLFPYVSFYKCCDDRSKQDAGPTLHKHWSVEVWLDWKHLKHGTAMLSLKMHYATWNFSPSLMLQPQTSLYRQNRHACISFLYMVFIYIQLDIFCSVFPIVLLMLTHRYFKKSSMEICYNSFRLNELNLWSSTLGFSSWL